MTSMLGRRIRTFLATCALALASAPGLAQRFDPAPAWPLCGRISDAPPPGWSVGNDCPPERWGKVDFGDFPLSDTFGPRARFSNLVYDYHRGIDIPTNDVLLKPVFAISAGVVSYLDPDTIELRHLRPGASTCAEGGGCWFSRYQHTLPNAGLGLGSTVAKGRYIGRSWKSSTGFAHVHFEIRDATPDDPESSWQRDAIHPLRVLPYAENGARGFTVEVFGADTSDLAHVRVSARVTLAREELDLARIEAVVYQVEPDGSFVPVAQSGAVRNGAGYTVHPPWLDIEERGFLFSHKDNLATPWSSFINCPYAFEHGQSYNPNVHVDHAVFDGVVLAPALLDTQAIRQDIALEFQDLQGAMGSLCFVVEAYDVHGFVARAGLGCQPPEIFGDGFESGWTVGWSATVP